MDAYIDQYLDQIDAAEARAVPPPPPVELDDYTDWAAAYEHAVAVNAVPYDPDADDFGDDAEYRILCAEMATAAAPFVVEWQDGTDGGAQPFACGAAALAFARRIAAAGRPRAARVVWPCGHSEIYGGVQ